MIGVTSVVAQVRICAFWFRMQVEFYGVLDIVFFPFTTCITVTLYGWKITDRCVLIFHRQTALMAILMRQLGLKQTIIVGLVFEMLQLFMLGFFAQHWWEIQNIFNRNVTKYIVSQMLSVSTVHTIWGILLAKHSCYEYLHFMQMSHVVCVLGVLAPHMC